jgi:WD40 repeat protein
VATGNKDGVVRLWRLNTTSRGVIATDLRVQGEPVRSICFAPNGRTLISAASNDSGKGTIQTWELEGTGDDDTTLSDCPRGVDLFALTSDGHWLFTVDQEAPLRVRNLTARDGKPSTVLAGQPCAVQALAVSANDRWLAAAGIDNTVRLWYLGTDGPAATPITIRPTQGLITGIAFARRGDWLATASDHGLVQCWNLQVDELIRVANARVSR